MVDVQAPLKLEDIPVMNFGRYMIKKMKEYRKEEALVDGVTGKTYRYEDIISMSERLAAGLQKLGVQKEDVVCILAPNHLEYPVTFYATALISAILRPVNPSFSKDDINKILTESQSKYVFTTPTLVSTVHEAGTGLQDIQVIVFGEAEGCISLESVLAPEGTPYTTPDADWKSMTAVLLPSGGTTGFPKAIQLSHFALIANGIQMSHAGMSVARECLLLFLPMFHGFGLVTIVATTHSVGCKLVIMPSYNKEDYLRLIEAYRPSTLHMAPPVMIMLAKDPEVAKYDLSSVKRIFCGAAPLSHEIEKAVKAKLNLTYIQQGYGLTEAGVTHVNKADAHRYKSVGRHMDLVKVKIVDVHTGEALESNQTGEVWIGGPQVAKGYLNLPAQNRDTFLQDGWVRTGDIGMEDDDGYLYIIDRLNEMITYRGRQIAPASLEDVLLRHESVADAGVVSVPDEGEGELPRAFIATKPGKTVTATELKNFVEGFGEECMNLQGGVVFVNDIPRSHSGKILRRMLQKKN